MMSEMDEEDPRPVELTAERREIHRRLPRGRIWVAAVAIFAFVGFTWYAYRQANKAGEEGVAPLIKAEQGPSRVKPDEPGGMNVPDQDKSVYERVGTDTHATTKVESLLPEPEKPMPHPAAAANPPSPPVTVAATTTSPPAETKPSAPTQTAAVPPPPPPPPSSAQAKAVARIAPAAGTPPETQAAKAPAPSSEMKTAAATPGPEASPSNATASGSYRVQLAALRSEQAADDQWKKLQKAYPDLLGSLASTVVKVDLGDKGTFYRLQAGALSEAAAKKLCEEMKSRKADCIVVKS